VTSCFQTLLSTATYAAMCRRGRRGRPISWGDGKAVPFDHIKSTLKALGNRRLKVKMCALLSNVAFKFNLRCYIMGGHDVPPDVLTDVVH